MSPSFERKGWNRPISRNFLVGVIAIRLRRVQNWKQNATAVTHSEFLGDWDTPIFAGFAKVYICKMLYLTCVIFIKGRNEGYLTANPERECWKNSCKIVFWNIDQQRHMHWSEIIRSIRVASMYNRWHKVKKWTTKFIHWIAWMENVPVLRNTKLAYAPKRVVYISWNTTKHTTETCLKITNLIDPQVSSTFNKNEMLYNVDKHNRDNLARIFCTIMGNTRLVKRI